MSFPEIIVDPGSAGVTIVDNDPSVSVLWDQAIQAVVIATGPGPTIASRAYSIMHTAMFEAWAAFDPTAIGTIFGDSQQVDVALNTDDNKAEAMSYAAYVSASALFPDQQAIFDGLMGQLGYTIDPEQASTIGTLGLTLGAAVSAASLDDGANQLGGYADTTGYTPVNANPETQTDIERWTPEYVPIDSAENLQSFLTPQWGGVDLFAGANGDTSGVFLDIVQGELNMTEGTVTLFGISEGVSRPEFQSFLKGLTDTYKGTRDWPEVRAFISDLRDNYNKGEPVEPLTLPISDELRGIIVEPDAPLPNPERFFVSTIDADLDLAAKTITLNGLDESADWRDFLALRADLRASYEGTEDWSEVREFIRDIGRSLRNDEQVVDAVTLDVSDNLVGTVINAGFIEQAEALIETSANLTIQEKCIAEFWEDGGGTSFPPGTWMTLAQFVSARDGNSLDQDAQLFFAMANAQRDAGIVTWDWKAELDYARPVAAIRDLGELGLIGEEGVDYLGNPGQVIEAWAGPNLGTQTILAENFITYQNVDGNPSPPFAEYTSGHSAFSAAGAEVLRLFTGSDAFGGEIELDFLLFEDFPEDMASTVLAYDTFSAAADDAGMSRIYGGIHFADGDFDARDLGRDVGENVWEEALTYINGTADDPMLF